MSVKYFVVNQTDCFSVKKKDFKKTFRGIQITILKSNEMFLLCLSTDVNHEIELPAAINFNSSDIVWVTKWVDYSNKYGFGFQLSNNSIGVFFNDTSRIIIGPDNR